MRQALSPTNDYLRVKALEGIIVQFSPKCDDTGANSIHPVSIGCESKSVSASLK